MNRRFKIPQTILLTLTFCGLNSGIAENFKGIQANNYFPAMAPVYAADAPIPNNLQGTKWYIVSGSEMTPLSNIPITIQFTDKDFSGNASCNNFRGTYTIENNNLAIDRLISTTRKACPEAIMAQEKQFVRVLPKIQSYRIDDQGILTLTYNNKGKTQSLSWIPESQFTPLHNTQWQLVSMAGKPPIADNKPPSLNFSGKSVSGSGGCNRLMGQFTVDGNSLSINEQMASTMMACPEALMEQEQQFVKALTTAREYTIMAAGDLVITYGDNPGQELKFTPVPNPTEAVTKGVEKIIEVAPTQVDCTGVGPQKCLQIKQGKADRGWKLHYSPIQGFNHEPGYTYRLRIRETVVDNPPADGSSIVWALIAVESKTPQ
jgi:heat shock protein HslJ